MMPKARFQLVFFIVIAIILFLDLQQVVSEGEIKCCNDNHIGSCVPGQNDKQCNDMCLQGNCNKGGACKVLSKPPPNHYCHCFCWSNYRLSTIRRLKVSPNHYKFHLMLKSFSCHIVAWSENDDIIDLICTVCSMIVVQFSLFWLSWTIINLICTGYYMIDVPAMFVCHFVFCSFEDKYINK